MVYPPYARYYTRLLGTKVHVVPQMNYNRINTSHTNKILADFFLIQGKNLPNSTGLKINEPHYKVYLYNVGPSTVVQYSVEGMTFPPSFGLLIIEY